MKLSALPSVAIGRIPVGRLWRRWHEATAPVITVVELFERTPDEATTEIRLTGPRLLVHPL